MCQVRLDHEILGLPAFVIDCPGVLPTSSRSTQRFNALLTFFIQCTDTTASMNSIEPSLKLSRIICAHALLKHLQLRKRYSQLTRLSSWARRPYRLVKDHRLHTTSHLHHSLLVAELIVQGKTGVV